MTASSRPPQRKDPTGRDHTPAPIGTSSTFLKIEQNLLTSKLYGEELDQAGVARLADNCQGRFKPDMTWTIDAMSIRKVKSDAREKLLELFISFREAGGKHILAGSGMTFVRSALQVAAMKAGIILKPFNDMSDIVAALNAAAKKS